MTSLKEGSTRPVAETQPKPGREKVRYKVLRFVLKEFIHDIARKSIQLSHQNKRSRTNRIDVYRALWQALGKQRPRQTVPRRKAEKSINRRKNYVKNRQRQKKLESVELSPAPPPPPLLLPQNGLEQVVADSATHEEQLRYEQGAENANNAQSEIIVESSFIREGEVANVIDAMLESVSLGVAVEAVECQMVAGENSDDGSFETSMRRDIDALDEVEPEDFSEDSVETRRGNSFLASLRETLNTSAGVELSSAEVELSSADAAMQEPAQGEIREAETKAEGNSENGSELVSAAAVDGEARDKAEQISCNATSDGDKENSGARILKEFVDESPVRWGSEFTQTIRCDTANLTKDIDDIDDDDDGGNSNGNGEAALAENTDGELIEERRAELELLKKQRRDASFEKFKMQYRKKIVDKLDLNRSEDAVRADDEIFRKDDRVRKLDEASDRRQEARAKRIRNDFSSAGTDI